MLNVLGYIKHEIEKGNELRPDATFVRIEDGQVEVLESKDEEDQRIQREREQFRAENAQLKEERDALREAQNRDLQNQRRKRIEEWRSVIRNFDFETEKFGATNTYSQMRQHLQGQIAHMFEGNSTVHLVNEARGPEFVRYELLDEVARIEKEWGLI